MKRITQAKVRQARQIVGAANVEYEGEKGLGPCAPIALALSRAGYGTLAVCDAVDSSQVNDKYKWYVHYVVLDAKGKVLDLCGEYLPGNSGRPQYRNVQAIDEGEILHNGPATLYGEDDVQYWQEALKEIL